MKKYLPLLATGTIFAGAFGGASAQPAPSIPDECKNLVGFRALQCIRTAKGQSSAPPQGTTPGTLPPAQQGHAGSTPAYQQGAPSRPQQPNPAPVTWGVPPNGRAAGAPQPGLASDGIPSVAPVRSTVPAPVTQHASASAPASDCGVGSGKWAGPFPVAGKINQNFGVSWSEDCKNKIHTGIDIAAPVGTSVYSVSSGKVRLVYSQKSWGFAVVVEDSVGNIARSYLHLQEGDIIAQGSNVSAGSYIGKTNSLNHVHYNVCVIRSGVTFDICSRGALGRFSPDVSKPFDPIYDHGPFLDPRSASASVVTVSQPTNPTPRPTIAVPAPAAGASTTLSPMVPANPAPGGPGAPGTMMSATSVALRWAAVAGADSYDLGVRDTATNRLVIDTQPRSTSYTARLVAGGQYRWNVRACNTAGCSAFTSPLYFAIPSAQTAPAVSPGGGAAGGATVPAVPRNTSPGRTSSPGTSIPGSSVTLNWDAMNGAARYELEVRDMTARRTLFDGSITRRYHIVNVTKGSTYRWSVKSCNANGCSASSDRRYFTAQ